MARDRRSVLDLDGFHRSRGLGDADVVGGVGQRTISQIQANAFRKGSLMRSIPLVATVVAIGVGVAAPARADCILFEDPGFVGAKFVIVGNKPMPAMPADFDNRASSIRVEPGCLLVAYHDPAFKGSTVTWGPGEYSRLPPDWNDVISSAQCNCRQGATDR